MQTNLAAAFVVAAFILSRFSGAGEAGMGGLAKHFLADQRAATAVEYALIIAVLSLVVVGGVSIAFNSVNSVFNKLSHIFTGS